MKKLLALAIAAMMFAAMGGTAIADDGDGEDTDKSVLEASDVQVLRAMRLAEYFEQDPEVVGDLRMGNGDEDSAIGWGALYKLLLLASATEGNDLGAYLDSGDFDEGWGFGSLFKELKDSDPEWLGDTPKNFGQWKKEQRQTDGWQPPGQAKKNG